jgi:hypothetical protein
MSVNRAGGFFQGAREEVRPNIQLYLNPLSYRIPADEKAALCPEPYPGFLIAFDLAARQPGHGHRRLRRSGANPCHTAERVGCASSTPANRPRHFRRSRRRDSTSIKNSIDLSNTLTYYIFRSNQLSRILYPGLRICRNLLLKTMGKTKINNLKIEGDARF